MSESDRFRFCAQRVFGKPVLMNYQWQQPGDIPCPAPREEIVRVAESREYRTAWLFESDEWVALFSPVSLDKPRSWYMRRLQIEETLAQLKQFSDVEGSRWLGVAEVAEVRQAVKAQVRTPVAGVIRAGILTYTAEVKLRLVMDCHRLKKDRESIVGLWGELGGQSRLFYGEKTAKGFVLLWDSPLIPAHAPSIEYNDLDGDGIEEILVYSLLGEKRHDALSVFDVTGEEISRQDDDCLVESSAYTEEGGGCPIVGRDATVARGPDGKKDIVVQQEMSGGVGKTVRYRLVGGRYVTRDRPSKVDALIAGLRDRDPRTRSSAASQLGEMGAKAKPSVAALARALEDEDDDVGTAAAQALGKLGPVAQAAVPALRKAASGRDRYTQAAAAEALAKIEARPAVDSPKKP